VPGNLGKYTGNFLLQLATILGPADHTTAIYWQSVAAVCLFLRLGVGSVWTEHIKVINFGFFQGGQVPRCPRPQVPMTDAAVFGFWSDGMSL